MSRGAEDRAGIAISPATSPSTRPAIPVVYVPSGSPKPLSAAQWEIVLYAAREAQPRDRGIWFVAVLENGGGGIWVRTYYLPDSTSPRLRKGRHADFHLAERPQVYSYVQVSRKDKPFPDRGDPAVPAPQDIPFPAPAYPRMLGNDERTEHVSDADLVRLIDFVRSPDALDDTKSPICSIVRAAGDVFGVAAGVSDLGGEYVHVRRDGEAFKVIDRSGGTGGWSGADPVWWPEPARIATRPTRG